MSIKNCILLKLPDSFVRISNRNKQWGKTSHGVSAFKRTKNCSSIQGYYYSSSIHWGVLFESDKNEDLFRILELELHITLDFRLKTN